jgi:transcriptional regulator with XRE-family HTH domain
MTDPTIGSRLRQRRTDLDLSLRDLHQRSGVSVPLLQALEADAAGTRQKLSGRDVLQLCKALGCGIDWLLHGTESLPPPAGAVTIFACNRGQGRTSHRCKECDGRASIQCDYALTAKASRATCDVWLCERCAHLVGKDRHYCPAHYRHAKQLGLELNEGKRT